MKNVKKALTLLLAAIMLLSVGLPAYAAADNGFTDVAPDAWYAEAVEYVSEHELMEGTGNGAFSPELPTSRAMLVTILYRAAESPEVSASVAFPDVEADTWYSDAVNWAAENKVVDGYDNGNFGPNDPVTREQVAAILWRYTGSLEASAQDFADEGSISPYASAAVDWARANGIVNGVGGNRFDPKSEASRAEIAQIIMNYLTVSSMEEPLAQTKAGTVRGTAAGGVYSFLGVPYAHADEMFVRAEPVEPWEGVREYTEYGAMSPQASFFGSDGQDNNCQNLNIWTTGLDDGGERPVMVWLHGGGFSSGTANEAQTNGQNLAAKENVVVVSVNHRLGAAGYLNLSAYGDKYADSANAGMWDVIDALQWIQDNIEAFGGDADNVTVFGQSGGGAKVLTLMATPYAEGLFDKGIIQSGATETVGPVLTSEEVSLRVTELVLDELGLNESNIENIQSIPFEQIDAAGTRALQQVANEYQIESPFARPGPAGAAGAGVRLLI